jgi:hypothetical protein
MKARVVALVQVTVAANENCCVTHLFILLGWQVCADTSLLHRTSISVPVSDMVTNVIGWPFYRFNLRMQSMSWQSHRLLLQRQRSCTKRFATLYKLIGIKPLVVGISSHQLHPILASSKCGVKSASTQSWSKLLVSPVIFCSCFLSSLNPIALLVR